MRLPPLSANELCRFLEKEGFIAVRQRGSHRFYKHADGRITIVPIHSGKNIRVGLLKSVLHQIGMDRDEFLRRINR